MIKFELLTEEEIKETVQHMVRFYAIDGYPIDPEKTGLLFKDFIQNPALGQCFLIKESGLICGYVLLIRFFSFEMGGYVLLLDELYISPEFQGKGIGKKAIAFVKEYAKENDIKKIVLEVEPHNTHAIGLYEKEQFRKHKRHLMFFP